MKPFLYTIGGLILLAILFMGGCRMISKHIFNQQDCKKFNIDNIELRTGINVPAIVNSTCECSEDIKDVEFTLSLPYGKMTHYIARNKFEPRGKDFINANEDEYTKWLAILDTTSQRLTIHIEYKK